MFCSVVHCTASNYAHRQQWFQVANSLLHSFQLVAICFHLPCNYWFDTIVQNSKHKCLVFHLLGCSCTGRASLTGGGFRLRLPTFEITIFSPPLSNYPHNSTINLINLVFSSLLFTFIFRFCQYFFVHYIYFFFQFCCANLAHTIV